MPGIYGRCHLWRAQQSGKWRFEYSSDRVVGGSGPPMFAEPMNVRLVSTTEFSGGAVAHVFRPVRPASPSAGKRPRIAR
jgi:hypothetical protein